MALNHICERLSSFIHTGQKTTVVLDNSTPVCLRAANMSTFTVVNEYLFALLTGHPHPDNEVETGQDGVDQAILNTAWEQVAEPVIDVIDEHLYTFQNITPELV